MRRLLVANMATHHAVLRRSGVSALLTEQVHGGKDVLLPGAVPARQAYLAAIYDATATKP